LVSGNGGDTVHALNVAAMTGTGEIPGVPQSAAAGPTITAASEHTGSVENALPTHLQQTLLKAAETGDLHLVQELLRQGADPNAEKFSIRGAGFLGSSTTHPRKCAGRK